MAAVLPTVDDTPPLPVASLPSPILPPVEIQTLSSWHAWRLDRDVPEGKRPRKLPISVPGGATTSVTKLTTGTYTEAYTLAIAPGAAGIALVLGPVLGKDLATVGVDLDDCRNPVTGEIAPWAQVVIDALSSYTEVSPSQLGIKLFALVALADLPAIEAAISKCKGGVGSPHSLTWKWRTEAEHGAAIEFYLEKRWFAFTGLHLPGTSTEFRRIDLATVLDFIHRIGPAFLAGDPAARSLIAPSQAPAAANDLITAPALPQSDFWARIRATAEHNPELRRLSRGDFGHLRDQSRSGVAMGLGGALKRAGFDYDDMKQGLQEFPATEEWAAEQEERAFHRIWQNAGEEKKVDPAEAFKSVVALPDADVVSVQKIVLQRSAQGAPIPNLANALTMARGARVLEFRFAHDEMRRLDVLMPERRPIGDVDVTKIQEWFQRETGLTRIAREVVHAAIQLRASENPFHPIRDFLTGLSWDGQARLGTWLRDYLGAEDSEYHRAVGRMFLLAMVARVMRPGCKVDHLPVLEGRQGAGKSSACSILAGEYYGDALPDLQHGDPVRRSMYLRGKWLIEIPELSSFSKSGREELKAFVTQPEECFTPKYGRAEVIEPRQCVFVGTTNESTYLRDETGGRRFWPVLSGVIDTAALARDRDQLFAEALVMFERGVPWHPDRDFESQHIAPAQEARFELDGWEGPVLNFLAKRSERPPEAAPGLLPRVTLPEVAHRAVGLDTANLGTRETRRLAAVMQRAGWEPGRTSTERFWFRPGGWVDPVSVTP
jgi:hypothetical protein